MSIPPTKILVALDDSDAAECAWKAAQLMARRGGALIEGLYVKQWAYAVAGYGAAPATGARMLDEAGLKRVRSRLPRARVLVSRGIAAPSITSWASRRGYDLLVMGTHGREGLERAVMGSVAEAVINASPIPVLVVRSPLSKLDAVLAPVNDAPYAQDGLLAAARWAAWLQKKLRVLHVARIPLLGQGETSLESLVVAKAAVASLPPSLRRACRPSTEAAMGDPAREIVGLAGPRDLIVLAAHSKGFLRDRVLGTTAQKVLRHTRGAVLAVPA